MNIIKGVNWEYLYKKAIEGMFNFSPMVLKKK